MIDRISKITQSLLESYHTIGGINHLSGPNLPSKMAIAAIIEDLESLIFPGFKSEDALEHGSLGFTINEKVNRLIRTLSTEILRSLCYERRIAGDNTTCQHVEGSVAGKLNLVCQKEAETLATELVEKLPIIRDQLKLDVDAAFAGDPASKSREEVILSYPGLEAITIHRFAHQIWNLKVPLIPRLMSEISHSRTGIDIHPGASIGDSFFIDHGTGVVIGETSIIGNRVKLYQGVTLGALSVKKEEANRKRHPTLEDEVTVYAGATILGGRTTIGAGSIIGGNVWVTTSLPAGSRVSLKDPELNIRNQFQELQEYSI